MAAAKGNRYAQKYTEEELMENFLTALNHAETEKECLSLADAIAVSNMPYSTYDYYAENNKVLGHIKSDTKVAVSRRINKGALKGDFQPASSIWRMKMLGEVEQKDTAVTTVIHNHGFTNEQLAERKKEIDDLI